MENSILRHLKALLCFDYNNFGDISFFIKINLLRFNESYIFPLLVGGGKVFMARGIYSRKYHPPRGDFMEGEDLLLHRSPPL